MADAAGRWQADFPSRGAGGPSADRQCATAARAERHCVRRRLALLGPVEHGISASPRAQRRRRGAKRRRSGSAPDEGRRSSSRNRRSRTSRKPRHGSRPRPTASRDFSAACYFLARDLRKTEKVPIGAIDDTWGGTPIRAWMDEDGGALERRRRRRRCRRPLSSRTRAQRVRQFGEEWGAWWRKQTGDKPGQEPWNASDRLTGSPSRRSAYWDELGPRLESVDRRGLAARRVTLTAAEAAQPATLSLSAIDDMDQTFVNGVAVGGRTIRRTRAATRCRRAC